MHYTPFITYAGRRMLRVEGGEVQPGEGDAPWAADLEAAFPDEAQRAAADAFLRENVQPYVTSLEERAQIPESAGRLHNDLAEAPEETFFQVATELFGEEVSARLSAAYADPEGAGETPAEVLAEQDGEVEEPETDPDTQEAIEFYREQKEEALYEDACSEVQAQEPDLFSHLDLETTKQVLGPFVAVADGDMEQAVLAYREWSGMIQGGELTAEQAAALEKVSVEPGEVPALTGGINPGAPVTKDYQGDLHSAVDDFVAEQRARNAPPPVGGV